MLTDPELDHMMARLDKFRAMELERQVGHRAEIVEHFDRAWRAGVDRDTFVRLFHNIPLFCEMLWTVGRVTPGEFGPPPGLRMRQVDHP